MEPVENYEAVFFTTDEPTLFVLALVLSIPVLALGRWLHRRMPHRHE